VTTTTTGATAADIEFHYDVGNDFYALWLDDTLTYSAALWDGIEEDGSHPDVLAQAQRAKLRLHLDQAALPPEADCWTSAADGAPCSPSPAKRAVPARRPG
jgi:cyclopropane-fatty-acyl-phospholipid synthase